MLLSVVAVFLLSVRTHLWGPTGRVGLISNQFGLPTLPGRSTRLSSAAAEVPTARTSATAALLNAALNKPSKTLAVILHVSAASSNSVDAEPSTTSASQTTSMMTTRSMQLRQLRASALATSDGVVIAPCMVDEQASAQGNFPGPAPVLLDLTAEAKQAPCWDESAGKAATQSGVSAVVVVAPGAADLQQRVTYEEVVRRDVGVTADASIIYLVDTEVQAQALAQAVAADEPSEQSNPTNLFVIIPLKDAIELANTSSPSEDGPVSHFLSIMKAIPSHAVVIAKVSAMQADNREVEAVKELQRRLDTALPGRRIHGVWIHDAIVGDGEDLEYAEWVISRLTQKRSSTFNVSGLTGSTNGHFGGVATNVPKTWLRPLRQQ